MLKKISVSVNINPFFKPVLYAFFSAFFPFLILYIITKIFIPIKDIILFVCSVIVITQFNAVIIRLSSIMYVVKNKEGFSFFIYFMLSPSYLYDYYF